MSNNKKSTLKLVLGASSIGDKSINPLARFSSPREINSLLDVFASHGYNQLDTSNLYFTSEANLGSVEAGSKFIIDTKVGSYDPQHGPHTKENILEQIDVSLDALRVKQINTYYLHIPDRVNPFEPACEAMDQIQKAGKIKQWGLSNYTAKEVQEILDICEEKGFLKPSVYQGHYNAVVRSGEAELFPILRKNGIAFYAYSASGAGFFAGNHKNIQPAGRFDESTPVGKHYRSLYLEPSIMAAAEEAVRVAAQYGIKGHAAALRWTAFHSVLDPNQSDAIVLGASSTAQMASNLEAIEDGPLPPPVVSAFEAIYSSINKESQAPYHM
jgi:aflatoxin B1 aldehyde reductase